jgi:two-component system nitrate/nitrite response regulator NarL
MSFMATTVLSTDRSSPQHDHDPITVVLVEDHEQLRPLLIELLTKVGIEVVAGVGSFDEGRDAALLHHPAVIVLGEHPDLDLCVAVCAELTQALPATPIVIHSTLVTGPLIHKARHAGAAAVITMNISGEPLITTITRLGGGMRSPGGRHGSRTRVLAVIGVAGSE